MSVDAGTIIHVGGNNVIDRLQSAGLGDVRVANDIVREIGNELIVDKVPQDPTFTFSMESFDVSAEMEAMLQGQHAGAGSGADPASVAAAGTPYEWGNCEFINITSPWKDAATGSAGVVTAGHLIPGYYPTRINYNFGVTEAAQQTAELTGGSFYYADGAPVEQFEVGDGSTDAFATDDPAIPYRIGGEEGTSFKSIFGIIVNGILQTEGVDYTQSPSNTPAPGTATVTFTDPPANGADIRFAYFTTAAKSFPRSVHASTIVKPGEVRGRNICVYLGSGAFRERVGSVQAFSLEATVDGEFEREFCNTEIVGYTINGRDVTGSLTIRSKTPAAFLDVLSKVTGVSDAEVFGHLNLKNIPLEVAIQNPKNPAQILKTLYVSDAIFQPPGTPARVNQPTDFVFGFESQSGNYIAYKGAKP